MLDQWYSQQEMNRPKIDVCSKDIVLCREPRGHVVDCGQYLVNIPRDNFALWHDSQMIEPESAIINQPWIIGISAPYTYAHPTKRNRTSAGDRIEKKGCQSL